MYFFLTEYTKHGAGQLGACRDFWGTVLSTGIGLCEIKTATVPPSLECSASGRWY